MDFHNRPRNAMPSTNYGLERIDEKNQFDHDTDMCLVNAKRVTVAAKIMKKEQKNIKRKQQKAHSKQLQTCIQNYSYNYMELKEAIEKMTELVSDGGFCDQTNVSSKKSRRALSGIITKETREERKQTQCMLCLNKENKIKQLQDKLNGSDIEEKEKLLNQILRSKDEFQERYKNEIEKCKHFEKKYLEERLEKENIQQRDQGRPSNGNKRVKSWTDPRKPKKRNKLEEVFDGVNPECMKCHSKDSKIKTVEDSLDSLKQRYEAEKNQRERYEYMYREEHAAKEDALRRLSSMASSNLRDNNPNITDLSDQNRPTKIAEKMSELYDNEWTEAFDALEKQRIEDRQIIQTLLDTFMDVYHQCSRLANENFFERVQRSIEMPVEGSRPVTDKVVLSDQLKQQVKEFRKTRAPAVLTEIKMVVQKSLRTTYHRLGEFGEYISRCIEIGWLCAVQDPPVVVEAQAPAIFDTNSFKDYTRRGKYTEYVVWPALYLHRGGPLLSKGVAQGCSGHAQTSNNESGRSAKIGKSPEKMKHPNYMSSPNCTTTVYLETQNPKRNIPVQTMYQRAGPGSDFHSTPL